LHSFVHDVFNCRLYFEPTQCSCRPALRLESCEPDMARFWPQMFIICAAACLQQSSAKLRGTAPVELAPDINVTAAAIGAQKLLPSLEASVRRVLAHLRRHEQGDATDGPSKARQAVEEQLENALKTDGAAAEVQGKAVVLRALALHNALGAAQDIVQADVQHIEKEQQTLSSEITLQQVQLLYKQLKQRRMLPMQSQLAVLGRKDFVNCSYAQQLLNRHAEDTPLYAQFQALLPKDMVQQLPRSNAATKKVDHLAAAGSDGTVHIVTSKLKNMVKSMAQQLTTSKEQLEAAANQSGTTEQEKQLVHHILDELNAALAKVHETNDLKVQLDTMYGVEAKLAQWMSHPA